MGNVITTINELEEQITAKRNEYRQAVGSGADFNTLVRLSLELSDLQDELRFAKDYYQK